MIALALMVGAGILIYWNRVATIKRNQSNAR